MALSPTLQPCLAGDLPPGNHPHWPVLQALDVAAVPPAVWLEHGGRTRDLGAIPLHVGPDHWHGILAREDWPVTALALQARLGLEIHPVLLADSALADLLAQLPAPDPPDPAALAEDPAPPPWPLAWPADLPPSRLARHLLLTAVDLGASDLHLEVAPQRYRLALRRHGRLRPLPPLTGSARRPVLEELRSLGGITPLQQGLHAEGRLHLDHAGRRIDFRLQSQPAIEGESLTARILDPAKLARLRRPEHLAPEVRTAAMDFFASPGGLFLITGPTDSGKTTTLHTLLGLLDAAEHRIITLETPVEYRLPGLVQIPCERDPDSRLPLAEALVSSLRAAPDLLVCGEIRTAAEARVVAEAALTGHRVLATLHAGDAAGALLRLRGLGLDRATLDGALSLLLVQRLGHRPCHCCSVRQLPPPHLAARIRELGLQPPPEVHQGRGCPACDAGVGGRTLLALPVLPHAAASAEAAWNRLVTRALGSANLTPESALRLLPRSRTALP